MKILKIGFFIVLLLVITQSHLFSTIYGRVEGVVRDKDTGKVLANIKVILHTIQSDIEETRTDKKGYFLFNKVKARDDYYIICRDDNYVSNAPKYMIEGEMNWIDNPVIRQAVGVFNLKEGEIRQVEISLEKGGRIKGKILQKDANGIRPFPGVYIELFKTYEENDIYIYNKYLHDSIEIDDAHTLEKGGFSYMGLRPANNYSLLIRPSNNFARQFIKDIKVRKNETYFIDFTFDFLSTTGIKGIVTKNGVPLKSAYIELSKVPEVKYTAFMKTDKTGGYSILMMQPGLYKIEYSYFDQDQISHEKVFRIEIEADELKIINIDF